MQLLVTGLKIRPSYILHRTICIYLWLLWVFLTAQASSSCSEQGLLSSVMCGLLWRWLLFSGAQSLGWGGSVAVAHGLSCPEACGIFPGQGSNLWCLHRKAGSYSLYHQSSPNFPFSSLAEREAWAAYDHKAICKDPGAPSPKINCTQRNNMSNYTACFNRTVMKMKWVHPCKALRTKPGTQQAV